MFIRLLFFIILINCINNAKVMIITHNYNMPSFIEIQYKTFKKFLVDDYEFVVFNDARNHELRNQIFTTCEKYGITCIGVPQEIHDRPYLQRWPGDDKNSPNARHANCIMYSLNLFGFKHNGLVVVLDSDMFLIKSFSFTNFMQNFDIAALPQSRGNIHYLWPGLVIMNMQTMPNKETINFNYGKVNDTAVDTGGQTYHYLKNNPHVRLYHIDEFWNSMLLCPECKKINNFECHHNEKILKEHGFSPNGPLKFFFREKIDVSMFLAHCLLHYRGISWLPQDDKKINALNAYMSEILNIDY